MSYQVLARKWRPRSFKEMAGQSHVLKTLINALDNDRLHHAYLFTGTRGVGKTTIARILARCLNCGEGVSSEPCGKCSACTEIEEGRFIDLIEVDAASRTKVEDTRELLDNVQYAPSRGRFKVYLIDEVHMLSGHSFNALLKTLEEPPPHVRFLLATTDPQKLPITVLSRCLQFNLKNISPERLVEHIKYILDEEKVPYEEPALWQLGRAAQGSVRDCLTLLDQAIGYCESNITDTAVRAFLGTIDQSVIHQLVDTLIANDAGTMLGIIDSAADHAPDFSSVLADLLSYLHRVAIAQVLPDGIDNSQGDRQKVLDHAGTIPAETLQLFYQIALKSREDLPFAIDARSGLEMALLRMLAFAPAGVPIVPESVLSAKATGSDTRDPAEKVKKKPPVNEAITGHTRLISTRVEVPLQEVAWQDTEKAQGAESAYKAVKNEVSAQTEITTAEKESELPATQESEVPSKAPINLKKLSSYQWISLFFQLDLDGITRSITANCLLQEVNGTHITLTLDESQTSVFNEEQQRRIKSALDEYFKEDIQLEIKTGKIDAETPSAWRERMEQERLQTAIQVFQNDEMVNEILERFSGVIQPDTIEPTSPKQY